MKFVLCVNICLLFIVQCYPVQSEEEEFVDPNEMFSYPTAHVPQKSIYESRFRMLHQQMVRSFWNHLEPNDKTLQPPVFKYLKIRIDQELLTAVHGYFANTSNNAEEVNSAFTSMIVSSSDSPPFPDADYTFQRILLIFISSIILLTIYLLFHLSRFTWSQNVWYFVLLAFLISFFINYYRLYMNAVTERHSHVVLPKQCKLDHNWSTLETFFHWWEHSTGFSKPNECEKHTNKLLVNPFWDITPLTVVAETLSQCFYHSFSAFGHHSGLLLRNLSQHVPFYIFPFILIILCGLLLCLLALCRGYTFRIPFLFSMEYNHTKRPSDIIQWFESLTLDQQLNIHHSTLLSLNNVSERGDGLRMVEARDGILDHTEKHHFNKNNHKKVPLSSVAKVWKNNSRKRYEKLTYTSTQADCINEH